MSNCDDVLDDWEDIDADKLETAFSNLHTYTSSANDNASSLEEEKFANSGNRHSVPTTSATTTIQLLQRSSKHNGITSASTTNTANITVTTTPSNFLVDSGNIPIDSQLMTNNFHPVTMVLHKSDDDYQSANYTASIANQTVKILRRPIQSVEPRNNEVRQKQPLKSLKQREQEYAEARLRIMGVAKNPEDDCASLTACGTQVQPPNSLALSVTNNIAANNVASKTSNTPRNVNNAGTTNPYNNSYSQQQQYQQQLPLHVPQQQQLQQLPSQTQLQQYPQNFHFNPQNYYYAIQHSQSHKSLPAYNNNRTQNMPLLGQAPLPRHNLLGGGASSSAIIGGNGCGPIKAQYPSLMGMTTKYQQQQHQQQQQQHQQQQQQQHQQQQQLQLQQSSLHQKILQQQQQQPIYHQPKLQQQTWSPVVGGKVSYTSIRYQHQQQQQHQQNESVVRSPRGPDGTTGFQIRR